MKLNFRLKEILEECKANRRGIVKDITKHTKLERHQVTSLMRNKTKYLSLDTLARICGYLIQHKGVEADALPGLLFGKEVGFWDCLAKSRQLDLCLGIRRREGEAWVTVNDAYLQGTLLYGISSPGMTTSRKAPALQQHLLMAPDPRTGAPAVSQAESLYSDFAKGTNRTIVAVGSVKINSITELIIARAMTINPFQSQDGVRKPGERKCPFFFGFRKIDPKPPSCCGGIKLSRARPLEEPGIYYEDREGQWQVCPNSATQDAALVFYSYQPSLEQMAVALGGFSGRATHALADALQAKAAEFWPPNYVTPELEIGAFIVTFDFDPADARASPTAFSQPQNTRVIRLDETVFERRLR